MSYEVFSEPWADAWADELRGSPEFRRAAEGFEGSILLRMRRGTDSEPGGGQAVYLELGDGELRDARAATAADRERSRYVIAASQPHWLGLLTGSLDPFTALMSGKLRLERGSLMRLARHVEVARQLIAAARRVDFHLPGESPLTAAEPVGAAVPAAPGAAASPPPGRRLQTTSPRGLDLESPPMQLFQKAKRDGVWDPRAIALERDRDDWRRLSELERRVLLHLTALFQGGEESVALDLLPLIGAIAREGRLEEELYLTSFLWEEAKHVELFRRFLDEVAGEHGDLTRFHGPLYRRLFYDELPGALQRLTDDPSPAAQARASVTYNMIVEGVLAETGYHAYRRMLARNDLMPGMQRAVGLLAADESRHLAYGVFLLSRLVAEHGEAVWTTVEERMNELLPIALGMIGELFDAYEEMPFGLELGEFTDFASERFGRRLTRIERARGGSPAELGLPEEATDEADALGRE